MKVVIFCGGLGVRMGEADAADPQADDHRRQPADPLAHHEVVRVVGARRLRALPRLQGGEHQGVLPQLQRGASNDFVLSNGGRDVELLGTDISSWRITFVDTGPGRRSPSGCSRSRPTSATTSTSSPRTATASRTRRCRT